MAEQSNWWGAHLRSLPYLLPTLIIGLILGFTPSASAAAAPLAPTFTQASLKLLVDNDFAVFMGDSSSVTRLFYQNNVAWMTQATNAATLNIIPQSGESYIYLAVMGGGGTEDFGGYLNGMDVVSIPGAQASSGRSPLGGATLSSPYVDLHSFITGYNLTDVANGVQNVSLADIQSALTGVSWTSAYATGTDSTGYVPNYKYNSGVCCDLSNNSNGAGPSAANLSGKGFAFPSGSLVVFRYPLSSLGLPLQPGNHQVVVDWQAPASGDAPTGYIVQYKKTSDPDTAFTTFSTPVAPTTIETVTGLTNGTSYTFRVAGTNSYGTGAWSETRTATPVGPPNAPTGLGYVPLAGSAQISFTDPSTNGGSVLTNYEYSLDGGNTWMALSPVDTVSPVSVPGLTDGTNYSIALRADNVYGSGVTSSLISVISGLVAGILSFSFATPPVKSIRANMSANVNVPGKVTFSIYGKRIPGCIRVATTGSSPSIAATCAWKPMSSRMGNVSVLATPTDGSYSSSTYSSAPVNIGRRSGTR